MRTVSQRVRAARQQNTKLCCWTWDHLSRSALWQWCWRKCGNDEILLFDGGGGRSGLNQLWWCNISQFTTSCRKACVCYRNLNAFVMDVFLPHHEGLNKGFILPPSSSKTRSSSCLQPVCVYMCVSQECCNLYLYIHSHAQGYINNGIHYCALFYRTSSQLTVQASALFHSVWTYHTSLWRFYILLHTVVRKLQFNKKCLQINPILRTVLALSKAWNTDVCTLGWPTCRSQKTLWSTALKTIYSSNQGQKCLASSLPVCSVTYTAVNDWPAAAHGACGSRNFMSLLNDLSKEEKSVSPCSGSVYCVMKWKGFGKQLTCTVVTQKVKFQF